jgi:hypothetical protein
MIGDLRSTFPLNEAAISRQALRQVLTDPITWVPLVPAVAAYTIFNVPAAFSLGFGALVLGGVGAYWRTRWAGITTRLRRESILEHNRLQDLLLKKAADAFQMAKENGFARKLEQFRMVKHKVELRLHENGEITAQKIQLEQLIDSLCFGVRDQLQAVLERERAGEEVDRSTTLLQVEEAYQTLQSTAAEIDTILGPALSPDVTTDSSIAEITRRLREETDIARRVQARLRAESQGEISDPPPRTEAE